VTGLPEDTHYEVGGCPDLGIPSCLACPLPRCRYDLQSGEARALLQAMRLKVLTDAGRTRDEAAAEMGVSRRTVYRLRNGVHGRGGKKRWTT